MPPTQLGSECVSFVCFCAFLRVFVCVGVFLCVFRVFRVFRVVFRVSLFLCVFCVFLAVFRNMSIPKVPALGFARTLSAGNTKK